MKRIVFCFDGTWNRLSGDYPTNVVLLAESVIPSASDGTVQIVYYDEGVGTSKVDKIIGGAFGVGLLTNLQEAYRFLIFNHEPGDEIFIFGFSRGAFTARSFAGVLRHCGILAVDSATKIDQAFKLYVSALEKDGDDHLTALRFRAENSPHVCVSDFDEDWRCENVPGFRKENAAHLDIKYVGVWDTVGALGWPNVFPGAAWLNRKLGYHDVRLTSKVGSARHALAIDERRKLFRPTLWSNVNDLNSDKGFSPYSPDAPYQQRWFPGVHGAVGGGGPLRGLSDSAFSWVLVGARRAGLVINVSGTSRLYDLGPNFASPLENYPDRPWHDRGVIGVVKRAVLNADRKGPSDLHNVSAFARRRWIMKADQLPERALYRPKTLADVAGDLDRFASQCAAYDHPEVETKQIRTHYVIKGDNLPQIAKAYLNAMDRSDEIYELNRDLIDDPREIHIGWPLRLPPMGDAAPGG